MTSSSGLWPTATLLWLLQQSMTQMGTSEGTLVEREVNEADFVRSSK
jgi:hypothetical protein